MQQYYTPEEVAATLRVTRRSVYEWLKTGRLRGLRAGNRWRIRPEDVEVFMQGKKDSMLAISKPADVDAEEHAARVDALMGKYADTLFSTEDLFRERQHDREREERRWSLQRP